MRKQWQFFVLLLSTFYFLLSFSVPVLAGFNASYLISDKELTNYSSMTSDEVASFLKKYEGALTNYQTRDIDSRLKTAAEIIYRASQDYRINPMVLLTLLQKEQSLITRKAQKTSQYDWATGFACYDNRNPVQKFKGFARQVDRSAWRLRYFLEHPWEFVFRTGQTYKISGLMVVPQNLATAALYNYTPHIRGNRTFWLIWQDWFGKDTGKIENGTLVKLKDEPGVWLIQNDKRRPFFSKNVFLASFSFKNIRILPKEDLLKYEIGEPMDFPNYSLLKNPQNEIYLKTDNTIRLVPAKIFREIGFNPEEIILADAQDLNKYQTGKPVSSPYPQGTLLQDKKNGDFYWVKDDIKYPILHQAIIASNFPYDKIIETDKGKLESFTTGELVKFRDGVLLKGPSNYVIYLISLGKKRMISSPDAFAEYGYRWEDVITVPENILNLHETGEPIQFINGFTNSQ